MTRLEMFLEMVLESGLWIETTLETKHYDFCRIQKHLLAHGQGIFIWKHDEGTDLFIRDLRGLGLDSSEYMANYLFSKSGQYSGCFIQHVVEAAPEPLVTVG